MILIKRLIKFNNMVRHGEFQQILDHIFYKLYKKYKRIDLTYSSLESLSLSEKIAHPHAESGGPHLDIVLKSLKIKNTDSILDIGCGKGGALITFSKYPFRRIAGVDVSEKLLFIAKSNFYKLKINNIDVKLADASTFHDLDDFNYIYMFNPFPSEIMIDVINNINLSLCRFPRNLTIIYYNPVCHNDIVNKINFKLVKEFNHSPSQFFIYNASNFS